MNFLAHMLLSCESDTLVTGNFLGDLLGNKDIQKLPQAIQEGVILHRKIDTYTDNHPQVRLSTRRLHEQHHKYASVLVDIYYDFFLARHWNRFHPTPLPDFAQQVYQQLLSHLEVMPERTQKYLKAMVEDDWLQSYSTYEGLEMTFMRIAKRVSRPQMLLGAVDSLKLYEPELETDFLIFFPEIMTYVQGECAC